MREQWVAGVPAKDQPRYNTNTTCVMWPVFRGENDWQIITIVPDPKCDGDLLELSKEVVLESLTANNRIELREGNYAVVDFDDKKKKVEYQLALILSEPFLPKDDPDPYKRREQVAQPLDPAQL